MSNKLFVTTFSIILVLSSIFLSCSPAGKSTNGEAQTSATATPTIPPDPPAPPPLISKVLEPSTSIQTLSLTDQVSVSVPPGLLTTKQTLAIAPTPALPPPTFQGIGEMAGYTITLGNIRLLNKPATIDITYDPTKLPADLAPDKALLASFWDTTQNLWVGVPITVDAQRHVVSIQTDHLSTWKLYYVLQGYGVKESSHFLVMYNPKPPSDPIVGHAQVDPISFASTVSDYLEQSYTTYEDAHFQMPSSQMRAFIDENASMSEINGRTGFTYFTTNFDRSQTLKQETAHELFHNVQNQYFNVYSMGFRAWWMEATADYAAYQVAWKGGGELSALDHNYFDKSITLHDGKHEYQTANFLGFLVKHGMDFKGAWDAVVKDGSINVLKPLEAYVLSTTTNTLQSNYRDFVRYTLFDPSGSLASLDNELLYAGVADHSELLASDQHSISYLFNLGPDYTANIWGVGIQAKDDNTPRSLHIEVTGTPPSEDQVRADVVVLKNDLRQAGGAPLLGTLDASHKKLDITVNKGDALYISAVNSSTGNQQISVKISDAALTINPDKATVVAGKNQTFIAQLNNSDTRPGDVVWSIDEGVAGGKIDANGVYTAPITAGTYHITVTLAADKTQKSTAVVTVTAIAPTSSTTTQTIKPTTTSVLTTTSATPNPTISPTPAPLVWVLVDKITSTSGTNGIASFSNGQGTASGTYTGAKGEKMAGNYSFTYTEPPARLVAGQKFTGSISVQDTGSVYPTVSEVNPYTVTGTVTEQMSYVDLNNDSTIQKSQAQAGSVSGGTVTSSMTQNFEFIVPTYKNYQGSRIVIQVTVGSVVGAGVYATTMYLYDLQATSP